MRNIKFRVWDSINNKWLLGYEYSNLGGFSMFGEVMAFGEYQNMLGSYKIEDWHKIKLMQFTGLIDINGKEIYEGDIVTHGFNVNYKIEFNNGSFGWYNNENNLWLSFCNCYSHLDKLKVLGNIYENNEIILNHK